jgi:hypothetical protein
MKLQASFAGNKNCVGLLHNLLYFCYATVLLP